MKVLVDQHVSGSFQAHLADGTGVDVKHASDEGWSDLDNGLLQEVAIAESYTHLVSYDKDMANRHPPHMPVLLVDDPNDERYHIAPDDKTSEALERRTVLTASAVARCLVETPPMARDYHAILVEGLPASKALKLVAQRRHKQHPDYETNLKRHIAEQRAKGRNPEARGGRGR